MKVKKCLRVPAREYTTLVFESERPLSLWTKIECGGIKLEPVYSSIDRRDSLTVKGYLDLTGMEVTFS